MTVISIPIVEVGSTSEINTWLSSNSDKVIDRVLLIGSYWYIFYE
jgi:hypothetical protein